MMTLVSAALFFAGLRLSKRFPKRVSAAIAALAVAVLSLYALWLNDNPILTRLLPTANVLVWGNLQLPAMALLAGIAWGSLRGPRWQRLVLVVPLVSIGIWRTLDPLVGSPAPIGTDRWTHGVCRQSSTSSCSAAAAATLLIAHGIPASEAEMIRLCLTHTNGTSTLGLYRGLKLKCAGTPWTVRAGNPTIDALRHWPLPAIVTLKLPGSTPSVLAIGNRHSVVLFGLAPDGNVDIGDPFAGRQTWTSAEFAAAYGGQAMALPPITH